MTCSYDEAGDRSHRRRTALDAWSGSFARDSFGWVVPPVLNKYTRVATEMCPADGTLRVVGYEGLEGDAPAQPVTRVCEIAPAMAA
jgi:hypothetical protein